MATPATSVQSPPPAGASPPAAKPPKQPDRRLRLEDILKLRAPGLLGCALSGAGPSVLVFYERGCEEVCYLVRQIFSLHGRVSEVMLASVATEGYSIEEDSEPWR